MMQFKVTPPAYHSAPKLGEGSGCFCRSSQSEQAPYPKIVSENLPLITNLEICEPFWAPELNNQNSSADCCLFIRYIEEIDNIFN